MAKAYFQVNADATNNGWTPSSGTDHFAMVDDGTEYTSGVPTADDATTTLTRGGFPNVPPAASDKEQFTLNSTTVNGVIGASDTINYVTVHWRWNGTTSHGLKALILHSGTEVLGTQQLGNGAYRNGSEQYNDCPGQTGWTRTQITSAEYGMVYTKGTFSSCYLTLVYVEVDYTPAVSNYPAPTILKVEGSATSITNSTDRPSFEAKNNASTETMTNYQVEIHTNSGFTALVADSGWRDFTTDGLTDPTAGSQCDQIRYDPSTWTTTTYFLNGTTYYWRIRFKDASNQSDWSTATTPTFTGWTRVWHADTEGYAFRRKLTYVADHAAVASDYTAEFSFKTGNRKAIATDAMFNNGIHPVGQMVGYYDGKTHVVYMSNYDGVDDNMGISIVSYDHATDTWGTSVRIYKAFTSFDHHNFGTLCIDNDGYIHVFFGCHNQSLQYLRSELSNVSGSLSGETASWINPNGGGATPATLDGGNNATYPDAFVIPSDGRVYVLFRAGANYKYFYTYTTNNGSSWSSAKRFIEDTDINKYRVYCQHTTFDEDIERLHLAVTYTHGGDGLTEAETGIWYYYCDYDTSVYTEGFTTWKHADGTTAGTTTTSPIDFDSTKAIAYGIDRNTRIFHTKASLGAKSGTDPAPPLIYWCEGFRFESDSALEVYDERPISCAKWSTTIGSAGSWTITDITDQTNLMLETRHICHGTMTDRNGVIRLYLPVNAKTYWTCKPDADVASSGVTLSSGINEYALIDDTISYCDEDTTYIDIAGSTGYGRYSSTETLPADARVLAVRVQAIVRNTGTTCTAVLYVKSNVTENAATGQSITWALTNGHYGKDARIEDDWTTDPDTSAAWTVAGAEACEFGIKNTTASSTLRVTALYKRIFYTKAVDDEIFACDIYELTSTDNGANWTAREITRNSEIGIPPFNNKKMLSNDTVEVVYGAGHNIFYLSDDPYGKVLYSCQDLKLFWGDTEIDRLIDFANLDESTIRFKTQEALSADDTAGTKDLYLYYGNPNESTPPLGDPNNVYRYFENFEEYDAGYNINSSADWTVNSGSGSIYSAPPDIYNKIYSGNRSLKGGTGSEDIEHTLGVNWDDVLVEWGMWAETLGSTLYVELQESTNDFRIGLKNPNDVFYGYGATNTSGTPEYGYKLYHSYKMHVGADGCSGWVNGEEVIYRTTLPGMTQVDKIVLGSVSSQAYWDFIRVLTRVRKETSATRTTGFDKQIAAYDSDHTSTKTTADAYHNITNGYSRITKIDVKIGSKLATSGSGETVDTHVWVSNSGTYDSASIESNTSYQLTGVNSTTWVYHTYSFTGLNEGAKSVKLDFYATSFWNSDDVTVQIEEIKVYYDLLDPVVSVGNEEIRSFFMDMSVIGPGSDQFTADMKIDGYKIWAANQAVIEYLEDVTVDQQTPVAAERLVEIVNQTPVGYAGNISAVNSICQVEWTKGVSVLESMNIGYAGNIVVNALMPVENVKALTTANQTAIEWLNLFSIDHRALIEYGQMVTPTTVYVPIEYLSSVLTDHQTPIAWSGNITAVSQQVPIEFGGQVTVDQQAVVEYLKGASAISQMPVEFKGNLVVDCQSNIGWIGDIVIDSQAAIEMLKAITPVSGQTPIEYLNTVDGISAQTPIEYIKTFESNAQAVIEWLKEGQITIGLQVPIEWTASIEVDNVAQIENIKSNVFDLLTPVGYGIGIEVIQRATVEWLQEATPITATGQVAIEWASGVQVDNQTAAEWIKNITVDNQTPVDYSELFSTTLQLQVETGKGVVVTSQVPVEQLVALITVQQMPLEWTGRALLALILANAHIQTAGLGTPRVDTGQIESPIVDTASLANAKVDTATLQRAIINVAKLLQSLIIGRD